MLLEKEKFFPVAILKEEYQNDCKRRISLGSVGFLCWHLSTCFSLMNQEAVVVKVFYLGGKIVAIFLLTQALVWLVGRNLFLKPKKFCVQCSQDWRNEVGD